MNQAIATVEEKGQNPGQSPEIDLSTKGWREDALSYAVVGSSSSNSDSSIAAYEIKSEICFVVSGSQPLQALGNFR